MRRVPGSLHGQEAQRVRSRGERFPQDDGAARRRHQGIAAPAGEEHPHLAVSPGPGHGAHPLLQGGPGRDLDAQRGGAAGEAIEVGPDAEGDSVVGADDLEAAEPALQAPVEDRNAGLGLGDLYSVDEHSHGAAA